MAWSYDDYLPVVTARESGGNDNAKNPSSSASGRYQFIDSTYLPLARSAFPGRSDDYLMSVKNNRDVQNTVMRTFTESNVAALQKAGIDVNNGSVYASHFLGGPGAIRAFSATDDTPIRNVVNASSISANPSVFRGIQTVADFKRWAGSYGGAGRSAGSPDAPSPDAVPTSATLNGGNGFAVPQLPAKLGPIGGVINPPGSVPAAAAQPQDDSFMGQMGRAFRPDGEPWSLSDALIGSGMSLMARDNPGGAAALRSLMSERKPKRGSPWEMKSFDPSTGRAIQFNAETGQMQPVQVMQPYREMSAKDREHFEDRHEKLGIYDETINDANKYRTMIANGEIDLSAASQFAAGARKLTDQSTQADRNAADYAQFIRRMQNAGLRLNAGVQTEGDSVRMLAEIAPRMSSFDNAASISAIDNIVGTSRRRVDSLIKAQNSVYGYYGQQAPVGTYQDDYRSASERYKQYDDDFTPKRDAFLKAREAANGAGSTAPAPRVAPARDAQPEGGSFLDFMRRRQAR